MFKSKSAIICFLFFISVFSCNYSFVSAFSTSHAGSVIKASSLPFPLLLIHSKTIEKTELLVMSEKMELNSIISGRGISSPAFTPEKEYIYYIRQDKNSSEIWRVRFNPENNSKYENSKPQRVTWLEKFITDFSFSPDSKKIFFSASDENSGYSRSSLYSKDVSASKNLSLSAEKIILKSAEPKKEQDQEQDAPFYRYSSPVYNELADAVFFTSAEVPFKNAKSFSSLSIWKLKGNKTEKMIGGFSGFDAQGTPQGFMACRPMNWHSYFAFIKTVGKIDSSLALYSPDKPIEVYRPDAMLIRPVLKNPWLVFGEKKENKTEWFMMNLDTRQKFSIDLPPNITELGL